MRVVHVSAHYPPYLGGLEKVVESLALFRSQRGLPVEVLTSGPGPEVGSDLSDPPFVKRLRSIEVAHTTIMPSLPWELFRLDADSVLHLHVSQAFGPELVHLTHLARHIPYVAHVHIDVGPSGPAGFLLGAYKPLVLGRVLRGAQSVVVFTEEQRQAIGTKYGIDGSKIAVIPNGVEASFYHSEPRQLHSPPRILFVGRLSIQKNVPLLLHALDGVSERFETTLVGSGDLEPDLKNLTRDLRLRNVRFHGRADGEALRDLFRQADILVLPSLREGMPLVLLEAMAMGLPIVATDIPGTRDVVVHEGTGLLVPTNDRMAMQKALLRLAGDPDSFTRFSDTAYAMAADYTWDSVGERFEQLYSSVASSPTP